MTLRHSTFCILACLYLAAAPLSAQTVFALPGPSGGNATVTGFSTDTLSSTGSFQATATAYRIIPNASGSKLYVISNSSEGSVYSVSDGLATIKLLGNLQAAPTGAALTPDGSTLYIAAGTLYGFSTSTDSPINIPGAPSGRVIDVDASIDGTQIFALQQASETSTLAAIHNSGGNSLATVAIAGAATSVTVGPNALVYVATPNQIYEIDPNTYAVLNKYQTPGAPGKPVFTPDGHYLIASNITPGSSGALYLIDVNAHTLAGTLASSSLPTGAVFDQLLIPSDNQVVGYSKAAQQLYQVSLSPLASTPAPYVPSGAQVTAAAITNDVAAGAHTTSQYLFFASGSNLTRVNLASGQAAGQAALPGPAGAISVVSPEVTDGPEAFLLYGNNQTVGLAALSQPIVIRAMDSAGRPQPAVNITFTPPKGVTVATPTLNTNLEGYASTTFQATTATGPISIQFSGVLRGGSFNATVSATGGGGQTPATMTAIAGQGELLLEFNDAATSGSVFEVLVADSDGNPLTNVPVTFTLPKGHGNLVQYLKNGVRLGIVNGPNNITVSTDVNGIAAIDFISGQVTEIPYPGFESELINASTGGGLSTNLYVSTVSSQVGATTHILAPIAGATVSGQAGQTIKGAFQFNVFADSGTAIQNVGVYLIPSGDPAKTPSASCAGTPLSAASGTVTCDAVLNGVIGSSLVIPIVGYFHEYLPTRIEISPGPPAQFQKIQGDGQSGLYGQTLQLVLLAVLEDAFGNAVANTPVTWDVTSGSATLTQSFNTSDANGRVETVVTLGRIPGPSTITVTASSGAATASATFTETTVVVPGGITLVSGNNQTAFTTLAFGNPLAVQALDNQGNGVPGATVGFAVTSGDATLNASSVVADANGNASVIVTAGATPGPIVVTAAYAGFSTTFSLTSRLPGPSSISFLNGASFTVEGNAPGAIAPGAIIAITGQNLAPQPGVVLPAAGAPPTELGGVQVLFGGIPAPIFATINANGNQQVNVLVPFELPVTPNTTSVTITNTNGSSTLLNVPVQPLDPGIFESVVSNQHYGVIVKVKDGSYVGPQNLAAPGDSVIVFAEGLGQATPIISTGVAGAPGAPGQTLVAPVQVTVNGTQASGVSAVYAPLAYGVYLVTFEVPSSLAPGLYPLTLSLVGPDGTTYNAQQSFIPVGK